jgi:glycosyltransferase involved in cell wall biosynthesis
MNPAVTAILCTRNRAAWLERALHSLARQSLPAEAREILVVDNASTDDTPAAVRRLAAELTPIRYLAEPRLGLSFARNAGWQAANGEIIAYLDDDAVAAPDWLERIRDTFASLRPQPGCLGGRVRLVWPGTRPAWASPDLDSCFGALHWSVEPRWLEPGEWIVGCNMAFNRCHLAAVGGFPTTLGRRGEALLSMEETALQRALARRGLRAFYHPDVVVDHHVLPERITPDWVERRMFWNGASTAILQRLEGVALRRRIREATAVAARLALSPPHLLALAARSDDPARFERRCIAIGRLGYLRGLLARHARPSA